MSLIVESQIRKKVKELNACISKEAYAEISDAVNRILSRAARRALANGRKTIKARDI